MKASAKFNRPASAAFHAITVVWGREYLDLFLNRCIPNQLGEGNVPALPLGSRYRIMTRAGEVDEVQAHPMVHVLARAIPVDVLAMEALEVVGRPDPTGRRDRPLSTSGAPTDNRFELMNECHRQAIRDAARAEAALIFLSPDHVLSANALASVVRRHREGYRAVVCTGLRLEKEAFLRTIDESGRPLGALPPRELVRLALPRLHAHTRSMFADARAFNRYPLGVYWRIGSDGLLGRSFHFHPLMIDPMSTRVMPKLTVDAGYVGLACPDVTRVHVVTDSDELVVFELTEANRSVECSSGDGVALWRAAAIAARCGEMGIGYWRRNPVRIHSEDLDERWMAVGVAAEAFVRAVMWRNRPFGIRSARWYRWLERTRDLHDRYRRAWRRRLPRVRLKQILRPVRLAKSRAGKVLRKTTRQLFEHVGTPLR